MRDPPVRRLDLVEELHGFRVADPDRWLEDAEADETEVLRLVAKGYTYKEIADQLFLSVKTVQNHVQNILTKLQLSRRYELMAYAIRRGLDRS
jgi:DNA-binding NarL/FixJ family response regulator